MGRNLLSPCKVPKSLFLASCVCDISRQRILDQSYLSKAVSLALLSGLQLLSGWSSTIQIPFPMSLVTKSFLTLWDPTDCSMPGIPVLHCLPEFAQAHVHWCHPTISSLVPLSSIFPSIRVFCSESALCIRWPKYWNFSFSIIKSLMLIYFCSLVVGVWEFTRFCPDVILSFFFSFCFSSDFYLSFLVGT